MRLHGLPTELLVRIIPLLDPVALIALSQANRHFRQLIQPTKRHLAERLLALECLEDYGGPYLDVRNRNFQRTPLTEDESKDMRWACAGCLRLLSHRHFNNHSLVRLRYRKPIPGTPGVSPLTSWVPSLRGKKTGQKHRFSAQPEERRFRRMFMELEREDWVSIAVRSPEKAIDWLRGYGIKELQDPNLRSYNDLTTPPGVLAREHLKTMEESRNYGFARHKRLCNECRFQTGRLKRITNGRAGSALTPMQPSRRVLFYRTLDRWFPGLSDGLDRRRPSRQSPKFYLYGPLARPEPWTLYMVRCSECEQWKELRNFRLPIFGSRWSPNSSFGRTRMGIARYTRGPLRLDEARCHACFAKENGVERLGQELLRWVGECIDYEIRGHYDMMAWGYCSIHNGGGRPHSRKHPTYTPKMNEILAKVYVGMPSNRINLQEAADGWIAQFPRVKSIWDEVKRNGKWKGLIIQPRLSVWVENFESVVDNWLWLKDIREEIKQKPDYLAHWALQLRDDEVLA